MTEVVRFERTVAINQPASRVFAFVSDLENDPVWSGASGMRRTSTGPIGVGTTFEQRARFLGRNTVLVFTVTAFDPGRKLAVTATAGPLSLFGERAVNPVGESASDVTFVGGGRATGPWRLAEPLLALLGAQGQRRMLSRLKRTLESPATMASLGQPHDGHPGAPDRHFDGRGRIASR